ncbi:glycosyl hydrolase family 65 protein [Falsirhodobacter xinxiangensis]|uniref:glycosyl hydrolase family 65 protein n=1 Tax=Falsirhodobacter xinxiangensis TaxID=2530049 RepID=UPI0010AA9B26|nr:glycosyl hydrolase family 65 protein [Rhodobacter xinxiangensis]
MQYAPLPRCEDDAFVTAFDHYDPEDELRRESLLSIGNGFVHMRASAPEERSGPCHRPGLYRAGCYARLTGRVEGRDVATDSLANLPNWLDLSFRLGEEWLSFDRVQILSYRQELDMRAAVLTRRVTFRDGLGRQSEFHEERFVSMATARLGALRTTLRAIDWSGRVTVRSGIDPGIGNVIADEGGYDPQALCNVAGGRARTLGTDVEIAVAARTTITLDGAAVEGTEVDLPMGATLCVEKIGITCTSRDHAIGDPGPTAAEAAQDARPYAVLREDHIRAWAQLWGRCRLEAEGAELSRALALHGFHLLQTASPHAALSDAGLPSRGWQEAYHGHIFWDDMLSLSFLSLHLPDVVRSALLYRHRRLDAARRRARDFGLAGALFPWRSGTVGFEETPAFQKNPKSGRWMRDDTRYQFHVGSAIAHNVWRYFLATGDFDFMASYGAELMVEIARMWASLAAPHPEVEGRFTIRGVVGPDEFHTRYPGAEKPGLDDETYTNVMAAWVLIHAAKALDRLPACHRDAVTARLAIGADEAQRWAQVAAHLHLVRDGEGRFLPFDRYGTLRPFDMAAHERDNPGERLDWFIEAQGGDINALQAQKQATFAMLGHLFTPDELSDLLAAMGHPAPPDILRRTIEADLDRTSHDSSLSDLIYAGALARLAPDHAWRIFRGALHPDDAETGHSGTEKGIHLGAMAASIDIVQRIFLGLRPGEQALIVDPAPQSHLSRISAHVLFRSNAVAVTLDHGRITIHADDGNHGPVPLLVRGVAHDLEPGATYEGTCE